MLKIMEKCGFWPAVRHLLCRLHVYEIIKRHYIKYFKYYPKRTQQTQMNMFIKTFKDIIYAFMKQQMRALWDSIFECDRFSSEVVAYIKKK